MEKPQLMPAQCRAARALLDWSRDELAARSGVSKRALGSFEAGHTAMIPSGLRAVVATFEDAGIVFTAHGVELKPASLTG